MDKHLPFIYLNSVRTILSFCKSNFLDGELERIVNSEYMILLNVLDIQRLQYHSKYVHHLVHLRYLAIRNLENGGEGLLVLSSISKLWNLQILILTFNHNHVFEVPDSIWDLVKLRHIHLLPSALFPHHDRNRFEDSSTFPENLKSLSKPRLHYGDSSWVCKFQRLEKLSCIFFYSWDDIFFQQYRFLELESCNRITSLSVENGVEENEEGRCKLNFPPSLRKLSLSKFRLDSDEISEIGKSLPNLEVLKLHESVEKWSVNDEDFPKLKVLKITDITWHEWDASEDSFPNLKQLWLLRCYSLKEIPLCFGDIISLGLISIIYCNPSVEKSAREIAHIQDQAQNLELKLNIVDSSWWKGYRIPLMHERIFLNELDGMISF